MELQNVARKRHAAVRIYYLHKRTCSFCFARAAAPTVKATLSLPEMSQPLHRKSNTCTKFQIS